MKNGKASKTTTHRRGISQKAPITTANLNQETELGSQQNLYDNTDEGYHNLETHLHPSGHNPNEDAVGRLKMQEVRELADDVDSIIGKLKGVDYGVQDLDVLIELAKQLKHKRLTLFPDTSNVLMSENFANYNANNIQ